MGSEGGLHIHDGNSCYGANYVGGHWWNASVADPWTTTYTSDEEGTAVVEITVTAEQLGYDPVDFEGHTVVVHDSSGTKVACGVLGGELCTASNDPTIEGTVDGVIYCVNVGITINNEISGQCDCVECDMGWEGVNCSLPIICAENEYVFDNECVACPNNGTNAADDDSSGMNTVCDEDIESLTLY